MGLLTQSPDWSSLQILQILMCFMMRCALASGSDRPQQPMGWPAPPEVLPLLVGAATVPILVGIWGVRLLELGLHQLGGLSEEAFRGDRLPTLYRSTPDP